jgi:putative flippase GtrA
LVKKIVKFGSVGAFGALTNISLFSVLTFLNVHYNIASILSFFVAVTQNYQLNKRWTFQDRKSKTSKKFLKYLTLSSFSFILNLLVLNLIVLNFGDDKLIRIVGQIIGIIATMGVNFLGSYLIIFTHHKEEVI